jgi:hypothetical protein
MCVSVQSTANPAAFFTVSGLALATGLSCFAAATAASTVATVAFGILGITCGGASIASVTAWLHKDTTTATIYFNKFKEQAGVAIAGFYQLFAQMLVQALIAGVSDGISKLITRKIAGPDVTYGKV